jgi:TPR repeat protein
MRPLRAAVRSIAGNGKSMNTQEFEPQLIIAEIKALLHAAWNTTDDFRYDRLIAWANELLQPLLDIEYPEALWIKCSMPISADEFISDEEFDKRHLAEVRKAAEAGNISAKFDLACTLDEEPTMVESASLFKEAAEAGHVYSKWCHGLNLLSGRGIAKDEDLGLAFIKEAGDEKFEGAIKFIADAYANGTYGYPKDEEKSAIWWKKLSHKDVVHY